MAIIRLVMVIWLMPIMFLIVLRLLPFVPMATFIVAAYVVGVLIGGARWAVLIRRIAPHPWLAMVALFTTIAAVGACLC